MLPLTYAWFMYFFPFDTVTFQSKDLNLLPLKSRADYWWIVRSWNVLGTVTFFSWVFENQMAIFSRSFKHLLHLPIFVLHSKSFYDHHCECSTLIFLLSKLHTFSFFLFWALHVYFPRSVCFIMILSNCLLIIAYKDCIILRWP